MELSAQSVNKDCIVSYVNVSAATAGAVIDDIAGKFDVYGLGWVAYENQASLDLYQEWIEPDYAMNSFAQAGWIAAHFFCEGLRRIAGQDITWDNYMRALEEAPIQNPFGGFISYADGMREGTQEMTLSKIVPISDETPLGWELVSPLTGIDELLK
jgi:hypothetical protein